VFAGKKSAQIREILISESAWEEMTCLFAPSLDAERSLFSTQQTILDLIYARQVNEINLFTALGGGWVE